jgi:NAD(P)-dependent dehydrogenase (short-subunit alcohol dehydrogenase family)
MLQGKTILITGASSGIGAEAMRLFAAEGATVIGTARRQSAGEKIVKNIIANGGKADFISADLRDETEIGTLFATLRAKYSCLHGAFNNASIEQAESPLHTTEINAFDDIMNLNVRSVWLCMRHELQIMIEQGEGSIVNVGSIAGVRGFPGLSVYTASKHAVIGMTKSAALDVASHGIRVNCINPGTTRTEMFDRQMATRPGGEEITKSKIPMGRVSHPSEQAQAALWLLSDRSSFVTGQVLSVDGGGTIR